MQHEVPEHDRPRSQSGAGTFLLITVAAIAAGLALAVAAVAAPLLPASTHLLTAAVLLAFAVGWALLALLAVRTSRPQAWALVPAAFLALAAVVALTGSPAVAAVFRWVWPPLLLGVAVWSAIRVRRRVPGLARWLLLPLLTVLALAAVAGGAGTVHEAVARRAHPPTGRLVDVGGHRLLLRCTGSGSPTVVVEPGQGAAAADLRWIEPVVARETTVCVYDRAGRGGSDDVDQPPDGARIVTDLRALLDRAGVPGPYVLAGHSFGGLYALTFSARFPDRVAGLVLLDSTSPGWDLAPAEEPGATPVDRVAALMPALGRVSAGRAFGSSTQEWLTGGRSVRQATALHDLRATPLLVLTAGSGHDAGWFAAQERLATLSSDSVHRVAPDTTHGSLVADEHDSAAASQAIVDVVRAVRSSHPLRPR